MSASDAVTTRPASTAARRCAEAIVMLDRARGALERGDLYGAQIEAEAFLGALALIRLAR
ncbi:MAG: hypothetical protein M1522_04000 [Actinobacteria bacterium]|nr:hypothetical protein [Actinomycetota bacterium]